MHSSKTECSIRVRCWYIDLFLLNAYKFKMNVIIMLKIIQQHSHTPTCAIDGGARIRGSTVITENPHLLKLQLHVSEKDEYTLIEQSTFTIYFELYLIIINQYLNSYVHDIEHNRPGPSYGMYQNIDLCSNCI